MGYAWDVAIDIAAVIGVVATLGSFVTGLAVMCGWKPFASKQPPPAPPPLVLGERDRETFEDLLMCGWEIQSQITELNAKVPTPIPRRRNG